MTYSVTAAFVSASEEQMTKRVGKEQGQETSFGGMKLGISEQNCKKICLVNEGRNETRLGYLRDNGTPTKLTRQYKKARRLKKGRDSISMFQTAMDSFLTKFPGLGTKPMEGPKGPKRHEGDRNRVGEGGTEPEFLKVLDTLNRKKKNVQGQGGEDEMPPIEE